MTTVYICVHPELVGLEYKLGAKRLSAIERAADRASKLLIARGFKPELSRRFTDWWTRGHARARVHNWFAVEHNELTPEVTAAIAEAAQAFCATLYEATADGA